MQAVSYTLIPFAALILGAIATVLRPPGPGLKSGVQHFSAGVVFAAAASEILPDLKHGGSAWAVLIGGGIGIVVMLTIEVLFLGLTLAAEFAETWHSRWRVVAVTGAVGLALPLGASLGGPVQALQGPVLTGIYAFGLIALLYLVTEELLVEAHERPDTPLITSMFFIGFLLLLMVEELLPA